MKLTTHKKADRLTVPGDSGLRTRGERSKRWLRLTGIAALALAALVLASTTVNLFLEKREKSRIAPYGERVPVAGGEMNVWRNRRSGPTIVLLGGLGTAAPALDFAPLIRELDDYNVVVVEGFGYGYSDLQARPRTIENITTELHDALSELEVEKPFILAGHSIAGFYTLAYANRYPEEVSAVIGIDPTVPAAKQGAVEPVSGGINWGRGLAITGVVRAALAVAPSLAEPPGGAYTENELARIRRMTVWNYGNPVVADETRRIANNAAALSGVTYPDALPVLDILAEESVSTIPGWVEAHEEQLRNVRRHEVVVLDGGHYLHWTKSRTLAEMITDFVGQK